MKIIPGPLRKPALLMQAIREPHYVFRPTQLIRRMTLSFSKPQAGRLYGNATLPWGLPVRYRQKEHIGHTILTDGLYDLCVCETLWRLIDPGETALDVGANIGQMTSLMASRVGARGQVHAFEPQPEVYEDLAYNAGLWHASKRKIGCVHLHRTALSDHTGQGRLRMPADFAKNRGTASVSRTDSSDAEGDAGTTSTTITLSQLDEEMATVGPIGVMKMDVEGHELSVLRGAACLLQARRIRDIVFEDFGTFPTPVTQFLTDAGYTVIPLSQSFWGVGAGCTPARTEREEGDPPSYLATIDPDRALARLRPKGWRVLAHLA